MGKKWPLILELSSFSKAVPNSHSLISLESTFHRHLEMSVFYCEMGETGACFDTSCSKTFFQSSVSAQHHSLESSGETFSSRDKNVSFQVVCKAALKPSLACLRCSMNLFGLDCSGKTDFRAGKPIAHLSRSF